MKWGLGGEAVETLPLDAWGPPVVIRHLKVLNPQAHTLPKRCKARYAHSINVTSVHPLTLRINNFEISLRLQGV